MFEWGIKEGRKVNEKEKNIQTERLNFFIAYKVLD